MKYLGIHLNNKIIFNSNINQAVVKLIPIVNIFSRTAKLHWGLGHKALKTIYEGAVAPILTYGAPIWVEAIRKNKNLANYKRIQGLLILKKPKSYRNISYDTSCVTGGV